MRSDTLLDYAVLQLSPKRSRCELIVSSDGITEKLASGLVKPYLDHLKVAEEQAALSVQSIRLEIDRHRNAERWFTKGTFERFVQYVGMPEILEMVNTFDAEMSQLEAARKLYSQRTGDKRMDSQGGDGTRVIAAADATTKELLRAIDVRLSAVRQDLATAYANASASGFNPYTVSQLKHFAHQFRAHRLNDACTKYTSVYERRPELINQQDEKPRVDDRELRSSVNSDMSIDNDDDDDQAQPQAQFEAQEQPKTSSTWQPPKTFTTSTSLRRSTNNDNNVILNQKNETTDNINNNDTNNKEQLNESSPTLLPSSPTPALTGRRLSVQDRINLFEKKQKENTTGKPVELRRMSSDVFRRWSSSSDMSIDVSIEKKNSQDPSFSIDNNNNDTESNNDNNNDDDIDKDNDNFDKGVKNDHGSSLESCKVSIFDEERSGVGLKDQVGVSGMLLKGSSDRYEFAVDDDGNNDDDDGGGGVKSNVVAKSLGRVHRSHSRSFSAQFESGGGVGFKSRLSSSVVLNGVDQSTTQSQLRSFAVETEDLKNRVKEEDSSQVMKTKYQKPLPSSLEQTGVARSKRDEIRSANESTKLNLPGKKQVLESQDNARVTAPIEQNQRVRQSKGNQEMHDELKLKADELEKLFAEHKLRVPGDQSGTARRIEPADNLQSRRPGVGDSTPQPPSRISVPEPAVNSQSRRPGVGDSTPQLPSRSSVPEPAVNSQSRRPGVGDSTPQPPSRSGVPEPVASSGTKSLAKMVDSHNAGGDALRQNFSELNFGDESRGKFYEKYMKKRNAKLQEEWSLNRSEKEARMKAMQDSLDRSRAEMKAKFSGSINRQNSAGGFQRAEKLGYFKSNIKRDQHPIDSLQNEEDEDLSEFSEEKIYGASKQSRKNFPNRNVSSGTPRTAVVSMSRPSGKRRDNPLAQSVPNFSDLRKENTKPSSGVSKSTRSQVRNYARSRSSNEEEQGIKEEKLRQTLSLRKSSANPAEFKDLSALNSDGIVLTPLKFDLDETDPGPYDQSSRSFVKKGSTVGPGFVGSAIRMKASMAPDIEKNKDFNDLEFDMEDSFHTTIEEQDEIGSMAIEDSAYNNNGKVSLSQESGNSGSEISDSTRSLAQADPILGGEMPNAFSSTFNGVGSLQESPVLSPVSWNSRAPHPFSYPHESSDIDASIDSPIGSPAWNSRSLIQGESDAARMRKKWGSAQKPYLVANSSQSQPKKDVTKGFKRLLKFGRKTRGTETLADWISATTSEGDDDMEDGRDLANRSSEDLRKSRMGLSHGHPSDESFNESELFNEQVQSIESSIPAPPAHFKLRDDHISGSSLKAPKSFFSLSTFRSKGSDSKPR
ncbi:dentin sialophosphoprotein-like [Trifolium pratense]|uniref:dentin sialophosphoprotein-like n=1 Tax=Trifolium pratense TaxID=57577 RepID=UPI001E690CD0|nr:dentin sialophosphoprotein-like [Trifolium pratense]